MTSVDLWRLGLVAKVTFCLLSPLSLSDHEWKPEVEEADLQAEAGKIYSGRVTSAPSYMEPC